MLRRVGAIGDIHAEDQILERVLRHLVSAGVDAVLAVGDIVDGRGDARRCCQLLQAHQVATVRGNHDRWLLAGTNARLPDATLPSLLDAAARAFLDGLPATRSFETVRGPLLLCHGLGDGGAHRDVINGHTHQRMVRRIDQVTFVNAGTIHRAHEPCFVIVDFAAATVSFYDIGDEIRLASTQALP